MTKFFSNHIIKTWSRAYATAEMSKFEKENRTKRGDTDWSLFSLAWDLGWMIAIPILLFGVGGAIMDKKLHSSPWLLLLGFVVSLGLTSFFIYFKISKVLNKINRSAGKTKTLANQQNDRYDRGSH